MSARTFRPWIVVTGVVSATLVLPALIIVGAVVGAREPRTSSTPRALTSNTTLVQVRTGGQAAGRSAPAADAMTALEANGTMRNMVEQHQAMMDEMRASATPQMVALMDRDPMWQMMRSGQYVGLLEQHGKAIDQMLARPPN